MALSMSDVAGIAEAELEPLSAEEAAKIGERGESVPPLLRARYTFKLPPLTDDVFFDRFIREYGPDGEPVKVETPEGLVDKKVKHLELALEGGDELGLTIIKGPERIGDRIRFRASTVTRARGPKSPRASDLGLLVVRAFGLAMPRTLAEMLATVKKLSNKSFDASVVYVGSCNPKKDAWVEQTRADGSRFFGPFPLAEMPGENLKGCGARLYNSRFVADPAAEDELARRGAVAICSGNPKAGIVECGARVRAFVELEAFGPAGGK